MNSLKQYLKDHLKGTRLLKTYYLLYPQRPLYRNTICSAWSLSRWVMFFRFRLRMVFYMLINGFRIRQYSRELSGQGSDHLGRVAWYNAGNILASSRRRSEHLIYLLRSITSVQPTARVLSIGPKTEEEVLLFKAHGFKDVQAIDLFSYSPLIQLMDMHHTSFPDNSFDVLCSGWVVRYSYDIAQCAREMIRISKNGSHIAIGFSGHPQEVSTTIGVKSPLYGGIKELLGHFEPHIDHVYWHMEDENRDETNVPEYAHSVVFRIKK